MSLQSILNAAGMLIGMAGAFMMYHFSPKVDSGTWIHTEAEAPEIDRRDRRRNSRIRLGMLLVFAAFLLQLVALLLPDMQSISAK